MATYQEVLNNTWDDPVFQSWGPDAKLLFLNLITSHRQNPIGLYAVTKPQLMFETGLVPERFAEAWKAITAAKPDYARVKFDEARNTVWIVNTLKHQRNVTPKNTAVMLHITNLLKQHNGCLLVPALIQHYRARGFSWLFRPVRVGGLVGATRGPIRIGKDRKGQVSSRKSYSGVGAGRGFEEVIADAVLRQRWQQAYPKVDLEVALGRMRAWIASNPRRGKSDWARFVNLWLAKDQDRKEASHGRRPGDDRGDRKKALSAAVRTVDVP